MMMCDFCTKVWHLRCLGLKRTLEGTWECPNCKTERLEASVHLLESWESGIEEMRREDHWIRIWRLPDLVRRRNEWMDQRGGGR